MSIVPARPPRHFRLTAIIEPPPDWWAAEFTRRQAHLRRRITEVLGSSPRPVCDVELRQKLGTWSIAEIRHALEVMVRLALVVAAERTEPENPSHRAPRMVTRTYYSLPGKEHT